MTPAFSIVADGRDVTSLIADRLLSLTVVDRDGTEADTFDLSLDNRDGAIAVPPAGAGIEIALGHSGAPLTPVGRYTVDRVGGSGPELVLDIAGAAADMGGAIRSPRTRSWAGTSLGDIAAAIARSHDLIPAIPDSIFRIALPYVAQSAESDLHFLTRLARDHGLTAKPAGGRLTVVAKGQTVAPVAPVEIPVTRLSSWSWERGERGTYASVTAEWQDSDGGALHLVSAGTGDPSQRLRHPFPTRSEAETACAGALAAAHRGSLTLSAQLAGFAPDLFAGGQVSIPDLTPDLGARWYVTGVTHRLASAGLSTSFEAAKAEP